MKKIFLLLLCAQSLSIAMIAPEKPKFVAQQVRPFTAFLEAYMNGNFKAQESLSGITIMYHDYDPKTVRQYKVSLPRLSNDIFQLVSYYCKDNNPYGKDHNSCIAKIIARIKEDPAHDLDESEILQIQEDRFAKFYLNCDLIERMENNGKQSPTAAVQLPKIKDETTLALRNRTLLSAVLATKNVAAINEVRQMQLWPDAVSFVPLLEYIKNFKKEAIDSQI